MNTKSIKIEQTYLKHLREKSKFSQTALALKAFADGSNNTKPESLIRSYQHIERTGKTSLKRATQLAKALNVNVQQLQFPELNKHIEVKLAELIKNRVEEIKTAGDKEGLELAADLLNFNLDEFDITNTDEQDYARFARNILGKSEYLYMTGEQEKLQPLADFLDMTAEELKPVAPVESYWWFSGRNRERLSIGKLVYYHYGLAIIDEIEKNWKETREGLLSEFQSKVTIIKQGKKYHLSFQVLDSESKEVNSRFNWSCEFCACDIYSENGIQWLDSSEWEHEELIRQLKLFLFNHADEIVIENEQFPPKDKTLVYKVDFYQAVYEKFDPFEHFSHWSKDGVRIFDNFWEFRTSPQSLLKEYDTENWEFSDSFRAVEIGLSEPNHQSTWEKKRKIKRYQISLGWLDNGIFHKAPWPEIKRKQFIEDYKKLSASEYGILVPDNDYVITSFEPDTSLTIINAEEL